MNDYDFKKYYNAEDVKDYDVFIGPDGEYYRVRNILDQNDSRTHYSWAEQFCTQNNLFTKEMEIKRKYCDACDILIDDYGFIRYSSINSVGGEPFIHLPLHEYYINQKQIGAIYNLLSVRREYLKEETMEKLEHELNGIDKLVDYYFIKNAQRK